MADSEGDGEGGGFVGAVGDVRVDVVWGGGGREGRGGEGCEGGEEGGEDSEDCRDRGDEEGEDGDGDVVVGGGKLSGYLGL